MRKNLRHIAALGATALALCLSANAQNFTNNIGGTYNASCGGTIRMKANAGVFDGSVILGSTDPLRIAGTVEWAGSGTSTTQTVQALYYVNLLLSGTSVKTIADVHVGGINACAQSYAASGGNRTYTGTFYYDGSQPQSIFAEGTSAGTYNNLDLSGAGTKTTSGTTAVNGTLASALGTIVDVNNSLTYIGVGTLAGTTAIGTGGTLATTGTAATSATGAITVAAGGALSLASTGVFDVTSSGSLTLATGASNFALGAGANFLLNGTFANNNLTSTNLGFDCNSTFEYAGNTSDQTLVATTAANKYGNLVFSGAATKTANGSVYVCGTSNIAGGAIIMGNAVSDLFVYDQNAKATGSGITFAANDNSEYIKGKVNLSGSNITSGIAYTMNNYNTVVKFGTVPTSFQLDVLPETTPTKGFVTTFDTRNVNRTVEMAFTGTAPTLTDLRVGYRDLDLAGWTGVEANLRFEEGYAINTAAQKLVGGSGRATVTTTTNPGKYVDLTSASGITLISAASAPGTTKELASTSQIILTSAPNTLYATTAGRWTNTNTWDEGALPTALDNVEIRTLVYAGIISNATTQAFNTSTTGNSLSELSQYPLLTNGGAVANSITIAKGSDFAGSALIIGNEDNGPGYVFHTMLSGTVEGTAAGLYNNNSDVPSLTWSGFTYSKATNPATDGVSGLFITNIGAANGVVFGTAQITNAGQINNHSGTIEVGQ